MRCQYVSSMDASDGKAFPCYETHCQTDGIYEQKITDNEAIGISNKTQNFEMCLMLLRTCILANISAFSTKFMFSY